MLVALWGLKPSAIDWKHNKQIATGKEMSVRVWKGGFMLIYFYVRTLVPMSYLKLWNYTYIYIYIRIYIYIYLFRPSRLVRPVVSRRRRPLSVRPSCRPSRRRRPSSVRPSTSVRRRRPSSVSPVVRPVVRLIIQYSVK